MKIISVSDKGEEFVAENVPAQWAMKICNVMNNDGYREMGSSVLKFVDDDHIVGEIGSEDR